MVDFNPRNFRMWSMMGVNPSIWSVAFPEILAENPSALALTADLGRYSGMMRTWNQHPDRFVNVGIAEQNMVGIAAGLAMCGKQVFMTTYAPFMTYRCADQMRHFLGNHNLSIKAIGSAAGLSAGLSGSALLAVGDIAFARAIPNMVVMQPADCVEAIKMTLAMARTEAPCYMRFCGAVNIPMVYKADYDFQIGRAAILPEGKGIFIAATGMNIVGNALKAADMIAEKTGVSPTVANFHTIKPLDGELLSQVAEEYDLIVSVEEHSVIGGLGGAIAEFGASKTNFPRLIRIGIPDIVPEPLGKRDYMLANAGLDAESIAATILKEKEK